MLPLITAQIKDNTLQWLCDNVSLGEKRQITLAVLADTVNVESSAMKAILNSFHKIGLIDVQKYNRAETTAFLILTTEGHDLIQRGGFVVLDALNEANLQKLLFELESLKKQLKPDQLETFNKIASIASSVATVLSAFTGNN